MAGIGCHYMAQWMDRSTAGFTQMGGEGANWIGEAPFSEREPRVPEPRRRHLLPLRPAGDPRRDRGRRQHHLQDPLQRRRRDDRRPAGRRPADVPQIARQVCGRGRRAVVVVTDEPEKYPLRAGFAPGVTVHHRDELDERAARAARDRRHHGADLRPDLRRREAPPAQARPDGRPARGACSSTSWSARAAATAASPRTASSVVPVETEFGRKRQIDQSSCNKDYSCLKGFCPSFVTVEGGELRKGQPAADDDALLAPLPEPALPELDRRLRHRDRRRRRHRRGDHRRDARHGRASRGQGRCGARHDRPGAEGRRGDEPPADRAEPDAIQAVRIAPGGARLLLGCDLVVAGGKEALATLAPERGLRWSTPTR